MISRIIKKTVDLSKIQKVDQLEGPLYQLENGGHTFEITCLMDGEAAAVSGTVSARFLRADEETVYFTGTLTGNVASITLPQSCYVSNGRFGLVVFVSGNDITSAVYAVAGNVYRSTSDHIIDPSEEIPSLEDLIAKIGECEEATASAQQAASFVSSIIASTYSTSVVYAVGDYCTYEGAMYRCTAETDGAFDPADWEAVKVGSEFQRVDGDVDDLKSAVGYVKDDLSEEIDTVEDAIGKTTYNYSANIYTPSVTPVTSGKIINSNGAEQDSSDNNATGYLAVYPGSVITYSNFYLSTSAMYSAFYDKHYGFISPAFKPNTDGGTHTINVPQDAYYVRFSLRNSDVTRFTASAAGTFEVMGTPKSGVYISGSLIDDVKSLDNQLADVSVETQGIENELCYKRTYDPIIYNPGITAVIADKCIKSDGTEGSDNDFNATYYLPVVPEAQLTYKNYYLIQSKTYAAFYDRDKNFLENFKPNTDGLSHTITVPEKAMFVRFSIKDGDLNRFTVDVKYRAYDYFAVPSYYMQDDYLIGKVNRIRNVMDSLNGNYDAFVFITDMHWLMNQQHSPALIKYLTDRLNIPRLFDGGDRANGINKECNTVMQKAQRGHSYFIIGNHEYINGLVDYDGNVNKNFVADDGAMYAEYNSFRDDIETDNALRGYYYVDNKLQKIRYIVLASFSYDDGSAATGGYEDAQLSWFTNAVNSTPAGWHILVLTHFIVSTTIAEYRKRFTDVLVNYSGDAKIIGIIEGHNHRDRVFSSDDETPTVVNGVYTASQVPILSITCDKNERWQSGSEVSELQLQDRPNGTIKEQAFDVIILDKTNKVIHQIRIGCPIRDGTDPATWTEMEERKTRFYDIT